MRLLFLILISLKHPKCNYFNQYLILNSTWDFFLFMTFRLLYIITYKFRLPIINPFLCPFFFQLCPDFGPDLSFNRSRSSCPSGLAVEVECEVDGLTAPILILNHYKYLLPQMAGNFALMLAGFEFNYIEYVHTSTAVCLISINIIAYMNPWREWHLNPL